MKFVKNFYHRVKSEKFFKSGSILFFSTSIGNLAAYFYQFAMSRLMRPEDFGTLNSLLSLFAIETVPVTVIGMVIIKYVSGFYARQEMGKLKLFLVNSFRNLSLLGFFLAMLVFMTRSYVAHFLKLNTVTPLWILALMISVSFVIPVGGALLQGLQLFGRFGGAMISTGLLRLALGVFLVWLGWGVNGGLWANFLASFALAIFFYQPLRKILEASFTKKIEKHTREILLFSLPVTLALLGSSGLINLDLILVKHFFSPSLAGQYAAAVILGRSIFYFPGALSMAMYPMINEAEALQKDSFHILKKCLIWTAFLSGSGLVLFMIVPDFLIKTLFGAQYTEASHLLPLYALAMLPLALSNIFIQFNLALRKYGFIYTIFGACVLEWGLMALFHQSLDEVLIILNVVEWALVMTLFVMGFRKRGVQNLLEI
ncbi:MAG: oligosaccharide flippase family protein [Chlamydiae bacterium]|nr:oligosaccharide flippase family protein [Chlamydiota bacterium]MBI3277322.1 oligosaccharide flippase family protein [Chlamydiota bacterium]